MWQAALISLCSAACRHRRPMEVEAGRGRAGSLIGDNEDAISNLNSGLLGRGRHRDQVRSCVLLYPLISGEGAYSADRIG